MDLIKCALFVLINKRGWIGWRKGILGLPGVLGDAWDERGARGKGARGEEFITRRKEG